MEYDYEDGSELPDLQTFKNRLIEDLFKSAFFQHKNDQKYNMLKLPILAAPSLLGKQVNNENKKKTLMEKTFEYEEETLATFISLVDNKELKINSIAEITVAKLKDLAQQLGIYHKDKTGEIIRTDLINLSKIFLAGQVVFWSKWLVCAVTELSVFNPVFSFSLFVISPWVTSILEGVILGFFNVALSFNSQTNKMIRKLFKLFCFPPRKKFCWCQWPIQRIVERAQTWDRGPHRRQLKLSNTFFSINREYATPTFMKGAAQEVGRICTALIYSRYDNWSGQSMNWFRYSGYRICISNCVGINIDENLVDTMNNWYF